ncbi:MAG: hypothetical protein KatS3mg105_2038 [Gemmatales bacterium]|nr:MAG: hypothetical protein KatS3mg105_2038 [Gemmatales bacterium]
MAVPTGRYRFTGREFESITGFQYHRARYYDPSTGRWTSQDPLGLTADINPYRYAGNSPVNAVDRNGMFFHGVVGDFFEDIYQKAVGISRGEFNPNFVRGLQVIGGRAEDIRQKAVGISRGEFNPDFIRGLQVINKRVVQPVVETASIYAQAIQEVDYPEALREGFILEADIFMFGQHEGVHREAQRIIAANPERVYSQHLAAFAREVFIAYAAYGLSKYLQNLREPFLLGGLSRKGLFGYRAAQTALVGLQFREAWQAGESFGQAYLDIRQGNSGMAALNLALGGLGVFGAGSGIRPTASFVEDVGRSLGGAFRRTGRGFTQRARAAIDRLRSWRQTKASRRAAESELRLVDRGNVVRNADPLTDAQIAELRTMAGQLGLRPDDIQFVRGPSAYLDLADKVLIGPNVYPSAAGSSSRSVLGRLTPRAVIAHEGGHLLTSRAGKALQGGSLLDEVQASLVARQMRGLSNVEGYQLLRDAVERARSQGQRVRDLLPQLPYFAE